MRGVDNLDSDLQIINPLVSAKFPTHFFVHLRLLAL